MPGQQDQAGEVLELWFVQSRPRQWFAEEVPILRDLVLAIGIPLLVLLVAVLELEQLRWLLQH
jgi:hypothetical protein